MATEPAARADNDEHAGHVAPDESGKPGDPGSSGDPGESGEGSGGGATSGSFGQVGWGPLTGLVAFAYVLWYVVDLAVLAVSAPAYNALHRFYGSLAMRVVWCAVLLALLFHALDGLRRTLVDLVPRFGRVDRWSRALVRFLLPAIGIPGAVVLLWPSIRWWFS